jgi:hypothetical protein
MRPEAKQRRAFWVAVVGAAITAIGSFGPWARAIFVTIGGLDRNGWLALLGAAFAGFMLYLWATQLDRRLLLGAVAGGGLALGIASYRASQIFGSQSSGETTSLEMSTC